ncbi:MAG: hypothetical protein HY235_25745 [Acidobacteria bacterium]|nr:hypothetical protein [Acidobacteriota bacterium]
MFLPAAGLVAVVYFGVLCASRFEASRLSADEYRSVRADSSVPWVFFRVSKVFRLIPVPRPYWDGFLSLCHSERQGTPVFFLGKKEPHGSRAYFLVALALKTPVALQALLLLALAGGVWTLVRTASTWPLFLFGPAALYIAVASFASLQLGIRLILPALPLATILCGHLADSLCRFRLQYAVGILLLLFGVESLRFYPYGISFFNLWGGSIVRSMGYLADSNLDWGHGLPALAEWVKKNGVSKINLFYFGTDTPYRYFRDEEMVLQSPPWSKDHVQEKVFRPAEGYYAISANLLPGHFFDDEFRDYFQEFRGKAPVHVAGYSILVYRVEKTTQPGAE